MYALKLKNINLVFCRLVTKYEYKQKFKIYAKFKLFFGETFIIQFLILNNFKKSYLI